MALSFAVSQKGDCASLIIIHLLEQRGQTPPGTTDESTDPYGYAGGRVPLKRFAAGGPDNAAEVVSAHMRSPLFVNFNCKLP